MRRLIMWNLITLEGYFEGAQPWDLDWHESVWGEELQQISLEQLDSADMLVFGRVTYEGMAAHWSTAQGAIAERMNRLRKVVCSRTLADASWNNTALLQDDVAGQLARLKHGGDGNMFLFGSANLARTLHQAGLFDEYRLVVAPVLIGKGRPLFAAGLDPRTLHLEEPRPLSTGGVILRYTDGAGRPVQEAAG